VVDGEELGVFQFVEAGCVGSAGLDSKVLHRGGVANWRW
jgi:hypothetical protein